MPFCRYGFLPPPRTSPRVLVLVRALARGGQLGDDDLVDQRDVGLHVEDLGRQLDRLPALAVASVGSHGRSDVVMSGTPSRP